MSKPVIPLARRADWVAQVRAFQEKIAAAESDALSYAMADGDVLIRAKAELKATEGRGSWGLFLEDCHIKERIAQVHMQLAAARAVIEAANPQSSAGLSIAGALRLITKPRPKSRPDPSESDATDAADPYSIAALRKLSSEQRMRLLENLGIGRADIPPAIIADLKHETAQAHQKAEDAKATAVAATRCLKKVQSALTTSARPANRIKNAQAVLKDYADTKDRDWAKEMLPQSYFPVTPPVPSNSAAVLALVGRGKPSPRPIEVPSDTSGPSPDIKH